VKSFQVIPNECEMWQINGPLLLHIASLFATYHWSHQLLLIILLELAMGNPSHSTKVSMSTFISWSQWRVHLQACDWKLFIFFIVKMVALDVNWICKQVYFQRIVKCVKRTQYVPYCSIIILFFSVFWTLVFSILHNFITQLKKNLHMNHGIKLWSSSYI